MAQIKCPHCHAELTTKNPLPVGTKVSCPKCKSPFEHLAQAPDHPTLPKAPAVSEPSRVRKSEEAIHLGQAEQIQSDLSGTQSNFYEGSVGRPTMLRTILSIGMLVSWGFLAMAVVIVGILFVLSLGGSKTVIEQAAIGAMASTVLIGFYVLARCVEKISEGVLRLQNKHSD